MKVGANRKYNPGFLSDDELVASFCIRTSEFESIVEMLRTCTGQSNPHQIVIGPRGSGKTSLLLRVAAEVRREADLACGFFPIVFAEESYEVGTAGEFWLECLARLADQTPHRDDAPDLNRTLEDLRTIGDRALEERCLAAVLDFADREGKRLVLLVENLNMMFRDITDRDAGWRLRKILQTEPRIVLLASATSRFAEIDRPDHAMYDLFRTLTLRPLDAKECAVLWETVSGQSRPPETIRSLQILTGGSPRLIAIVARFGAGLSFRELMDSLLDLVDDHTEYFKSHLELLPPQERRVYLALADLWKPALTKEIAARARLTTSMCSAQLARLIERGGVLVAGGSTRRKLYYLSERLYNIYYLLRRNRRPNRLIEALIQFMTSYYSQDELRSIGNRIVREAKDLAPQMLFLHRLAHEKLMALPTLAERGTETTHVACSTKDEGQQATAAATLFEKGVALSKQARIEDALAVFDELVSRFGESKMPTIIESVAKTLVNKGAMLNALDRQEEALAVYEEALSRFRGSETPVFLEGLAKTLVNKGIMLGTLGRPEEALAACDEVLGRFAGDPAPTFVEVVAKALLCKGMMLDALRRPCEALAAYEEVVHQFSGTDTPALLESVTTALVNKGVTLGALDRPEEALAACEEALRQISENGVRVPLEQARALVNKGVALWLLNRPDEALAAYDEVLRRFSEGDVPVLLERVARALVSKGVLLAALGQFEEALTACEEVLHRFGGSGRIVLPEQAVEALVGTLMRVSIALKPARVRDAIQGSVAANLLLPLTTALEQEMGLAPRVAREVEEVAQDIRRKLATLRDSSSSTSATSETRYGSARK